MYIALMNGFKLGRTWAVPHECFSGIDTVLPVVLVDSSRRDEMMRCMGDVSLEKKTVERVD